MGGPWWFKSLGEEFGPLEFSDLQEAARTGTLTKKDAVREGGQGAWRRADSVSSLFPPETPQQGAESEWMVEIVNEVIGPLSLADLATMIRERKVLPSDRIRHIGSQQWLSAGLVLQHQGSSPLERQSEPAGASKGADSDAKTLVPADSAMPSAPTDELERLILEVLAKPVEGHVKPTLAELGLAEHSPAIAQAVEPLPEQGHEVAPSACGPSSMRRSHWSVMNLFRKGTTSPETATEPELSRDEGSASSVSILPPIERHHNSAETESMAVLEESSSIERRGGFPWLTAMLLVAGVALFFQIFPDLWTAFLARIDVRNWGWRNWVVVEIAVILILGGLSIWGRMRRTASH